MAENNKMSDIIKASLEGVRDFTGVDTVIGNAITTASGVTVIPVSKVSVGFASGGVDYGNKKIVANQNFGGGSGTGISVTPLAFLTVGPDATVNLIKINGDSSSSVDRIASLIEHSPDIIEKIKNTLF
jgi:sporulation protein YtfJ